MGGGDSGGGDSGSGGVSMGVCVCTQTQNCRMVSVCFKRSVSTVRGCVMIKFRQFTYSNKEYSS